MSRITTCVKFMCCLTLIHIKNRPSNDESRFVIIRDFYHLDASYRLCRHTN